MSAIIATLSSRNLVSTPTSEFLKSGPLYNMLLSDNPTNFAEHSKTTLIFPGLWGWYTPWWGICHVSPSSGLIWSKGTLCNSRQPILSWRLCSRHTAWDHFPTFSSTNRSAPRVVTCFWEPKLRHSWKAKGFRHARPSAISSQRSA